MCSASILAVALLTSTALPVASRPADDAARVVVDDAATPRVAAAAKKAEPAPAPAPEVEEEGPVWSFLYAVNDWYPVVLDPHLEPEVEEKVLWLWVTTVFCGPFCGPLWIPMVIVGEDPGEEYFLTEALWAIFLELLTYVVGGVTTSVGGLGAILITANLLYFAPVSLINGYDRALKRERARTPSLDEGARARPPRRAAVAMAY